MTNTTKTERQTIANTILEQLSPRGANGLRAMLGVQHFVVTDTGVEFRFKGSRKFNWVAIDLAADDTYMVRLGKMNRMGDISKETRQSGIFAGELRFQFEYETGLRTGL